MKRPSIFPVCAVQASCASFIMNMVLSVASPSPNDAHCAPICRPTYAGGRHPLSFGVNCVMTGTAPGVYHNPEYRIDPLIWRSVASRPFVQAFSPITSEPIEKASYASRKALFSESVSVLGSISAVGAIRYASPGCTTSPLPNVKLWRTPTR